MQGNYLIHNCEYDNTEIRVYINYREYLIQKLPGNVARMEEGRSAFKILTGKPTRKRLLGRPKRR